MDAYWINWLFCELEQKALEEMQKFIFLAQTTDPDEVKKHYPELNRQLVENSNILKKYHQDTGMSKKGNAVKSEQKALLEAEIVHRASWFLQNPEAEYKEKVDRYRSSTLAEGIKNNWFSRRSPDPVEKGLTTAVPWKNQNYIDVPSLGIIQNAIKSGVKSGRLPEFLLSGKPKK